MSSQENLYEILDALGISAIVGDGQFTPDSPSKTTIHTGSNRQQLLVYWTPVGAGIFEDSMTTDVFLRSFDMGILLSASMAQLTGVWIIDMKDPVVVSAISHDITAFVSTIKTEGEALKFVKETIEC